MMFAWYAKNPVPSEIYTFILAFVKKKKNNPAFYKIYETVPVGILQCNFNFHHYLSQ
jgi:hypothetical protein